MGSIVVVIFRFKVLKYNFSLKEKMSVQVPTSCLISPMLACIAADSFPFSGSAEIEQANEKRGGAKEHAWGEPKNWGEVQRR